MEPATLLAAATLAVAATPAVTQDGASNGALLMGVGFDAPGQDNPNSMRLSLRGEAPITTGEVAALGLIVPVGIASSSDSGFGWSSQHTALELAPSARLRLAPDAAVRPYADAGWGMVVRFSNTDTWFGDGSSSRIGMMTRTALGAEIGGTDPGTVALVLEPLSFQRYGFDETGTNRFAAMAGISSRW